jgi:hypothetical protein
MAIMFTETKTSAGRILGMAETRSAQEIASILNIDEDDVCDILQKAGKPVAAIGVLTCNKTGRHWNVRSERGAYRMAQLKGLVDWDYVKE